MEVLEYTVPGVVVVVEVMLVAANVVLVEVEEVVIMAAYKIYWNLIPSKFSCRAPIN